MSTPELVITPRRSALLAGHANTVEALVRIRAPGRPAEVLRRQSLNLALVIDRSGSMQGKPLAEARRCAEFIVEQLSSEDRVSIVAYDSEVDVLVPARRVGSRAGLREAIRAIESRGMTALYDGWYEGAGQAALGTEEAGISRVLLLSDGQANRGLTAPDSIASRCAAMADAGVTTSTYGLGQNFNEDLMVAMARAGRGNHYYGQTADDLMDPFREEFELLQAIGFRQLRLALQVPAGVSLEVLNDYPREDDGRWRLPDLAFDSEAWAAVRLTVPAGLAVELQHGSRSLLEARLTFVDADSKPGSQSSAPLVLPILPAEAYAALASDSQVAERFGELAAAGLQERARLAARRGDWATVDALLEQALADAQSNPWLAGTIEVLRGYAARRELQRFSKEALFTAHRLRSRLAAPDEAAGDYSVAEEAARTSFLRRKPEQGKRLEKPE
jgi:Ca-activated chloride channel family protein